MYGVQLVFIIKCKFVYKELEDFLENRNLDVQLDQFTVSKIVSKSNLKRSHLGLLFITETTELY
jgi:hypothetical protein